MPVPPIRMILINGPKRVGKTTNADLVVGELNRRLAGGARARRINMADRLKSITNALYDIRTPDGLIAPPDYLEPVKDKPLEILGGATFRQTLIYVSEKVIKPRHGRTVFGKWFLDTVDDVCRPGDVVITGDTGFASEIVPIANRLGGANLCLVRLHGLGATFDGDSRSYVRWRDVFDFSDEDFDAPFRIGAPSVDPGVIARGGFTELDVANEHGMPELSVRAIMTRIEELGWLPIPSDSAELETAEVPTP